jgi:hypothetical protein
MRQFVIKGLKAAFILLVLAGVSSPTWAQGVVSRASGHGNLRVDGEGNPTDELRTFSFAAVRHADGTVVGQAEFKNRTDDLRVHVAIDCLVFDGNQAVVVGHITRSTVPEFGLVGDGVIFGVEDNGEGRGAEPDRISFVFPFPAADRELVCELAEAGEYFPVEVNGAPLFPIEGGNVQVQP